MSCFRLIPVLCWISSACGPVEPEVTAPFIALDRDVARFREWPHVEVEAQAIDGHGTETHRIYANREQPAGAEAFAVGTILVKTVVQADGRESEDIHAMAKRGAGFNAEGAKGWEFLGLGVTPNGATVIGWRGARPPADGEYGAGNGSETAGDCNACHVSATNDAVLGGAFRLAND